MLVPIYSSVNWSNRGKSVLFRDTRHDEGSMHNHYNASGFTIAPWILNALKLGEEPYFVKEYSDSKNKYTEEDMIKMLEFLVDTVFVVFAGKVFQQIFGIPVGTKCAPLLADIFLFSYEAEFIKSLFSADKKR